MVRAGSTVRSRGRGTIMLRRSLKWVFLRHVMTDASRLLRCHGFGAIFVAQHASAAARETRSGDHWNRVRAEVEMRVGYRPW